MTETVINSTATAPTGPTEANGAATGAARSRTTAGTWLVGYLTGQFERPRGPLGRIAGRIMSKRGTNVDRNLWLIDRLEIQAHHRVLELGPGPGVALAAAAERVTAGHLVAVDHSAAMLRQTAHRNRDLLDRGRLTLVEGKAEAVPVGLGPFDRIYSMNVWQFWSDQEAVITSLVGLLEPGGRLAIGYQPRHRGATDADADAARRCLVDQLTGAGLGGVTDEMLDLDPPVACVVGTSGAPSGTT